MADDDNFDIDIYGDGEGMDEDSKAYIKEENEKKVKKEQEDASKSAQIPTQQPQPTTKQESEEPSTFTPTTSTSVKQEDLKREESEDLKPGHLAPLPQGTKRKGESDERRIDAGATNALMLSDLHWYTTEDDIREWASDAGAEDELRDITFSEHKVNGKSKGQAFVEFSSPQASTALKHRIESLTNGSGPASTRKFQVVFTNAASNPFKTLPKDAPARAKDERSQRAGSTPYSAPPGGQSEGGYRGSSGFRGRGGYVARGGYQNQGNYNQNRNFRGSMQNGGGGGGGGGFNGQGFQPGMSMMNQFGGGGGGGFNNRGGGAGGGMRGNFNPRGGRGGGAAPGPMNNPMPMMGMNMAMMGMNPMMTGMSPQGFGNAQFNPAMFGQGGGNQGMNQMNMNMNMNGGDWGHGPKRQRQD